MLAAINCIIYWDIKLYIRLSIKEKMAKSVAYADDRVQAGSHHDLIKWWDKLIKRQPRHGYYSNAVKSLLTVEPEKEN